MKLTEQQQNMVSIFLKDSGETVRGLSSEAQVHAISQVKTRLKNDLNRMGDRVLKDEEVAAVLERCRVTPTGWQNPARPKPTPVPTPDVPTKTDVDKSRTLSPAEGWLGVCRSLSKRFGYDVGLVRSAFMVFGVLTGPVALITYLGLFFENYVGSRSKRSMHIDEKVVLRCTGKAVLTTTTLYVAAYVVLAVGEWTYIRFVSNDWAIGGWDWMARYQHIVFFCVLFTLTPVSVLSALPLSNQWGRTLERCVQAGWVLYAAFLCMGIAAALAGSILGILSDFALWDSA